MEAQVNNMKEKIEKLKVGQTIIFDLESETDKQRIKNYCHTLTGRFKTRTLPDNKFSVERISKDSKDTITDKVRRLKVGQEMFTTVSEGIVGGTVGHVSEQLDRKYDVVRFVRVKRLK